MWMFSRRIACNNLCVNVRVVNKTMHTFELFYFRWHSVRRLHRMPMDLILNCSAACQTMVVALKHVNGCSFRVKIAYNGYSKFIHMCAIHIWRFGISIASMLVDPRSIFCAKWAQWPFSWGFHRTLCICVAGSLNVSLSRWVFFRPT